MFESKTIKLEKIDITVGNCQMTKYREVNTVGGCLSVKEHKEVPVWYLRELKIKELGL